jgi:hypothetical protein
MTTENETEGVTPAALGRGQEINPWSVEGAQDEHGQVAAIDYLAISQYVPAIFLSISLVSC